MGYQATLTSNERLKEEKERRQKISRQSFRKQINYTPRGKNISYDSLCDFQVIENPFYGLMIELFFNLKTVLHFANWPSPSIALNSKLYVVTKQFLHPNVLL